MGQILEATASASCPSPRISRLGESGVTLLELLITIAIIMILASVAMPMFKVSGKRTKEIELRQELRTLRATIDAFKADWNREGDVLMGQLCVRNRLTCKEVSGVSGYPKSLQTMLEVKLTGEEATVKGATIKRYLRRIPMDPMTGKMDWRLRCYVDPSDASSWCGDDIYDLASTSTEVALDGTKYRDW
jgi:general secretion pathway protein G